MTQKRFDINDLMSIWNIKSVYKKGDVSANKLHVESNPVLTEVFNMTRTLPVVVDVKRMVQKYVGLDPEHWWGWSLREIFGEGVKSYMNLIHPEDLVIHEKVNYLLFDALADCSHEEKEQLRIVLNFRLRKSDGTYAHITQVTRILELDIEDNIQTLLVLLRETNYGNDFIVSYIRLWGIPRKEKLYEYRLLSHELLELELPTKREKEIIGLLIAGQDSQQIAEQLFISKNTIDTHRRRILQKFCLKSTAELTRFVSLTHLLDTH